MVLQIQNIVKMKLKILLLWTFVMLLSISMNAQTLSPWVISSSGGFYPSLGGSASLSFTVAEMTMVQTFTQPSNILTQGFQQPEQLTTSVFESNEAEIDVMIYPNPTNGLFSITFKSDAEEDYQITIYNLVGQRVYSQSHAAAIGPNQFKIDIGQYRQGIYLLEMSKMSSNGNKNTGLYKVNLVF